MAWLFDKVFSKDLSDTTDMLFDGRDIWVIDSTGIHVLGYWDEQTEYEQGIHSEYFPNFSSDRLVDFHDIAFIPLVGGRRLLKVHNTIYVTMGNLDFTTLTKIDINTKSITGTVTLPFTSRCRPCTQGTNIWLISKAPESDTAPDTQYLWKLDTTTEISTQEAQIPGRKGFFEIDVEWTYDNYILVAGYNQSSVLKFDLTGSHISTTPTNRRPRDIWVNSDRDVYVASINGMLTHYDYSTDTVSNDYTSIDDGVSVTDLDGWLWTATDIGGITKTKITTLYTNNIMTIESGDENYKIDHSQFDGVDFRQVMKTNQIDYQWWNGTALENRTVNPYLVFRSDNKVHAVRYAPMYRKYNISILMTGMISTGQQNYYGETE